MRRGLFFIVFLFLLQAIFSQEQKQLVVVSTEDDVVNPAKGSLRWACMQATEDVSVSITFSFSEIGPKVIKLKDELSINGEVRIDGSSYVDSVIIDGMDVVRNFYLPSSFSKLELNNLKLQGPLCVEASKNSILKIENSDIEQIACIACSCDIDNSVLRGTLNFVSEGIFHVENCKFENGASVACPGNPSEELILSKNLLLGDYTVSSSYGPLFVTRTFQVSKPHIDTAYVQYGEIFIEGHVDSLEVVDVELFVSKYDTYKAEKYLGAVKTKSDGSFVYRGELDSSLINGETISISATATYDEKLTSEYSSYAIDGHYWIVTNTNSTGEGTLKWACQNATQNDTIIFLFNEPGNKVIKSDGEFVLGASVDGSSFPDSIIIKPGFSLKNRVPVIKDIVIEGNKKNYGIVGAVSSSNVPDLIENCVIRNCSVGVHGANKIVRCQILNNKIGVYSSPHGAFVQRISDCVVSGNDSIGIDGDYYCIENCIIGLTPDQKHPMPNGIGIMGETRYNNLDTLKNNVISGNRYDGIVIGNRAHVRVFEGNLVGTNKYFDLNSDLGNGGSGLVMTGNSSVNFFFNNYFVNNKEYGVRNSTNSSLTINSSYFGVDKSANPMPNKLAGIYTDVYSELNLKNCSISNNGDGIKRETVIGQTTLDSCVFDNNSGFGVSINLTQYSGGLEITNSKFSSNGKSAVSLAGILPPTYKFSNNLFENTQRKSDSSQALDLGISLPIPQLTTISYEDGQFTIIGKVDTMSKANIELYYTNGELQTAHKFLKSDSTSVEGDFSFTILEDEISESGKIYFSATATYGRRTSQLSEPFSCNSCCTIDTIIAPVDTVFYGEKFLDKVYAIGRHDSIFETIALPNGCDSVVMHTLIVKPDPTKLNYYVKTERWGAGDGSSWENAMDGDDFIFMLPQVGDGVTFHVAEGRYVKEGNALSNKINSSVKIIGGYEAEAKTGAVSDPKKYHTVFESLPDKYGYGFSNLCFYELTNTESVVELSNLDLSHSGVKGKAGKLVVDSCSFYDCYLTLDISVDTLIVSNSYFGKILEEARLYNGINHIRQQGKFASISACTFEGNSSSSLGIRMIDISASGAAHIENCTFANLYNRSTGYQITLASSNDTVFFVNNTIVGNIHQSSFSFTNVAFIGNIIAGSSSSLKDGKILKSEYNLVGEGSSLSNSDKDVNSSDLVEILNGTYDASTGLFTPVLADNGGFTPTVALKSDRLPDGTSIRFPLSETTVATDQRGVERFPLTCMGAYELEYDTSDCEIGTIIFKEDFGGNYRSDPDFGPALPNGLTTLEYGDNLVPYNGYSLRKEALKRNITNCSDFSNVNKHIYCGWYADFDDHTSEGDFDRGYFMQIDMDRNKTIFYTITINDLCEHTHLNLMMWVHPVNSKADSELILSVEDLSGNVLASEAFVVESSVNEWSKISIPFTVPLNQTSIVYKIYSEADSYGGDIAIDDIEVRLCKPAVSVNAPEDYLCATSDYKLTATYGNKGGYIEPVNYTWFTNSEPSYEIEGWTKVSEGKELQLENISSDAYYRCVISSAGVEGVFDKCNSASDIIPVLLGELNDTSFVADTILTGEIYNGNQYFEVGTFDGIVETIHRDGTCDSIVLHELHVVREDFCSLATLSSNPITKSSDYLQFTSSYPRDLKFTIMDKEGNIVCKTVERTYGAGEHKVSLFKLFGIDKRDFDPLTPYILVVSSGNDLFMTYIYISWM